MLVSHWLGLDHLPRRQAMYNAARPLHVLGGVSDSKVAQLRRARGSHAKAELALSWLREFVIREGLSGSLGDVHASIVSRVVQIFSAATEGYYQARKVAAPWAGATLTFLTSTSLVGLHEVARELENPFRNVPNKVPLPTLMAAYNETLVTMLGGYHPDALLWDPGGVATAAAGQCRCHPGAPRAAGKDRRRSNNCNAMGMRNATTTATTAPARTGMEGAWTTNATESMTTSSSSSAMDCPLTHDGCDHDYDPRTFATTGVAGMDPGDNRIARELLENMLAKQATEVKELCRLLDRVERYEAPCLSSL